MTLCTGLMIEFDNVPLQDRIITPKLASSLILINVSKSKLNTHCEICFLGKDADFYKILNAKVVFSFGENKLY